MDISKNEWDEMNALRKAIGDNFASVHSSKAERFVELFVRTLPKQDIDPTDNQATTND